MRLLVRTSFILATVMMVVSSVTPAMAKGPQRATITGPELDHEVSLGALDTALLAQGTDLLTSLSLPGCRHTDGCSHQRPGGGLGPRFTITYTMLMPNRSGHEERSYVVQYVYPEARPKAVAYIPPGQHVSPWPATRSTWVVTERDLLSVAGIDASGSAAPTAAPTSFAPAVPDPVEPSAASEVWLAAVIAGIITASALFLVIRRRGEHPVPPHRAV
jgi:hypothetical protein